MTSYDDNSDPPTAVGAAGEPTTIVPPTATSAELAWSLDNDAAEPLRRQPWGMAWGRAAVFVACGLALATAIGAAVFVAGQTRHPNAPVAAPSTMPAWAIPPISSAAPKPVAAPAPSPPAVTSTVTVAAPAPAPPASAPPPTEGRFAICPSGHSGVATTVTSYAFAENVRRAYLIQGGPEVLAYSPVTGETYTMECIDGFTAHLSGGEVVQAARCAGGNNAVVVVW